MSTIAAPNRADPLPSARMTDRFGRRITYVRLSVTDRCDLRCRYCMSDKMAFAPPSSLLTIDEIGQLAAMFIDRGVSRIRLTGGEPLVRSGIDRLCYQLGRHLGNGLDELTMTTNGVRLEQFATHLFASGIRRINISLDSLEADRFRTITRHGDLRTVLRGIESAAASGLKVKINMVALNGMNDDEIAPMLRWCGEQGYDLTLIETMPVGKVDDDRGERFLSLGEVGARLQQDFALVPSPARTGGPARYYEVEDFGIKLGFITPLSANFCDGCNRVRVTATGRCYACLGHDTGVELRDLLRNFGAAAVHAALDDLIQAKPRAHDFDIRASDPSVARHMSVTGG